MFNLFTSRIEKRLFPSLWPSEQDLDLAIGRSHPARRYPFPIQAQTAIANFAICSTALFSKYSPEEANRISQALEEMLFEKIEDDTNSYSVSDLLLLPSERMAWQKWTEFSITGARANFDMIIRLVYPDRFNQYKSDHCRGILAISDSIIGPFGPVGFLSKRSLSHISGIAIRDEASVIGKEFDSVCNHAATLTWTYFNGVFISL